MAKPKTAAKPEVTTKPETPYSGPHGRRVRAIRQGNNDYRIVEEVWTTPPDTVRVLKDSCARISAEDRVRLWLEEYLGHNRFGDSGL